ncbi:MAG: replication-associated recombination protein A [Candidatus Atribacteria bacterium]|nr:replication-associated recombination protein A [Candidatus Atribacteria bacterium]MCD6350087.1 replication-associated recombination protein A [Candidatus Atribacteria bacterium]
MTRSSEEPGLFTPPEKTRQPLAARMRPKTLDELVGQAHLTGPEGILRRIVETGYLPSLIFWGPPGSGKTSAAFILADLLRYELIAISAVSSGIKEIREAIKKAESNFSLYGKKTIFFIDEIHRFHKGQQSVLLPYVEEGVVILIGSTTENPSFEVIAPLLSRTQVLIFNKISSEELVTLLKKALSDPRGLDGKSLKVANEALRFICDLADGDARRALNFLEFAYLTARKEKRKELDLDFAKKLFERHTFLYDKSGETHYDLLSAYHKSLRGSDPDAALYWMCRMFEAGEAPSAIARRLIACASEDVGNADPYALLLATAAWEAYNFLGEPEGRLALAQATIYVACAPKSNASYRALQEATADVRRKGSLPVPLHLRNPITSLMKDLRYGENYLYAHDFPKGFVKQNYFPPELQGRVYYRPTDRGYEKKLRQNLESLWGKDKG